MIWQLIGWMVFGPHPNPSFYARLSRREAPVVGESVSALMARLQLNLERDFLARMVAVRMVLLIVVLGWIADAIALRPVTAEQAAAEAREQIQAREREVEALRKQARSRHFRAVPGGAP